MMLNNFERYERQMQLPELGMKGQLLLANASVLVIGAGGLGCAVLPYLAAAGVGTIGIADSDVVALHNLHRQLLYTQEDVGLYKSETAAKKLHSINSEVTVIVHTTTCNASNVFSLLKDYDIIVDATDNLQVRYLLNDACEQLNKPWVYGSIYKYEGQVSVFCCGKEQANYKDLFPDEHKASACSCNEAGVLGPLPGIIGSMQALEVIKIITGIEQVLSGKLLVYNTLHHTCTTIDIPPRKENIILTKKQSANSIDAAEISPHDFERKIQDEDCIILDVREWHETPTLTLQNLIRMPLSELSAEQLSVTSKPIIVVCSKGLRSRYAVAVLSETHAQVYSLQGGITAWLPIH